MESRDKEIERLNQLLDGGRPVDAVLRESKKDSSERVVAHLNVQVFKYNLCFGMFDRCVGLVDYRLDLRLLGLGLSPILANLLCSLDAIAKAGETLLPLL